MTNEREVNQRQTIYRGLPDADFRSMCGMGALGGAVSTKEIERRRNADRRRDFYMSVVYPTIGFLMFAGLIGGMIYADRQNRDVGGVQPTTEISDVLESH